MKLTELTLRWRRLLDDLRDPYLWSDDELTDYANDSIEELCERVFVIEDSTTSITTTQSLVYGNAAATITGTGFIAGGWEGVDTVTVSGTALNDGTYTIVSVTNTVITTATNMVSETISSTLTAAQSITIIPIVIGTSTYDIDDRIVRIKRAKLNSDTTALTIIRENCTDYMDWTYSDWENAANGDTSVMLLDGFGTGKFRMYVPSSVTDTLYLSVYRRPLVRMSYEDGSTESPEIPAEMHRKLDNGVLSKAYRKQDSEMMDIEKANIHKALWEKEDMAEIRKMLIDARSGDRIIGPPKGTIL